MASVENLLKETLEVRISERNGLIAENRLLIKELVALRKVLLENETVLTEMEREFGDIWDQNCILENIVRKKNAEIAELSSLEETNEALVFEMVTLNNELVTLKKINETLVSQVNTNKTNQDTMFKQFLLNVRDLVQENHRLKENLRLLEKNLADAKNDFKTVCQRLAVTEKHSHKKYKVSVRN